MTTSRITALASLLALTAAACSAPSQSTDSTEDAVNVESKVDGFCRDTGDFGFRATGSGFGAYAGKTIAVSAIEPEVSPHALQAPVVLLTKTIGDDGAVDLGCEHALTRNLSYPSWAAWLDLNGDGKCGAGDLVSVNQRYGWLGGEEERFNLHAPEKAVDPIDPAGTFWASTPQTAWGDHDVCAYYGFAR